MFGSALCFEVHIATNWIKSLLYKLFTLILTNTVHLKNVLRGWVWLDDAECPMRLCEAGWVEAGQYSISCTSLNFKPVFYATLWVLQSFDYFKLYNFYIFKKNLICFWPTMVDLQSDMEKEKIVFMHQHQFGIFLKI